MAEAESHGDGDISEKANEIKQFQAIFNCAKGCLHPSSPYARNAVLLQFLFQIHLIETGEIQVLATDFHSNTWHARYNVEQLQKMKDESGYSRKLEDYLQDLREAMSSEGVKMELGGPASAVGGEGATSAVLKVKIKPDGKEKDISFHLQSWEGRSANDAMGALAMDLYEALQEEKRKPGGYQSRWQSLQNPYATPVSQSGSGPQPSLVPGHMYPMVPPGSVGPAISRHYAPIGPAVPSGDPQQMAVKFASVLAASSPLSTRKWTPSDADRARLARIQKRRSKDSGHLPSPPAPELPDSPPRRDKKRSFRTADAEKLEQIMKAVREEQSLLATKGLRGKEGHDPAVLDGETLPWVQQNPDVAISEGPDAAWPAGALTEPAPEGYKRTKEFKESDSTLQNDAWSRRIYDMWRNDAQTATAGRQIEDLSYKELNDDLVVFFQEVCKQNGDLYPAGSLSNMYFSFQRILRAEQVRREEEEGAQGPLVNMREDLVFLPAHKSLEIAMETSRQQGAEPEPRVRRSNPDFNNVHAILAHPSNNMGHPHGLFTRVFCHLIVNFRVHKVDDLWRLMESEFTRGTDASGFNYWDFEPEQRAGRHGPQPVRVADQDAVASLDEFFRRRPDPEQTPDGQLVPRRLLLRPKDRTPRSDTWFLVTNVGRRTIRGLLVCMGNSTGVIDTAAILGSVDLADDLGE